MARSETAVVIACQERGDTLPQAIESVLSQTASAQEIVVVDDGPSEALTRQVLAWLDAHEPRVRVIGVERRGVAHARNVGIAATSAPFVLPLDASDLLEPTYLEQASALLREREDLSFVCCALQAFGRASFRWKPPPYTLAAALGRGECGHVSTVFRRELWEQGPGFDESLPAYEDIDFWLRALRRGLRGAILDEALVRRRIDGRSPHRSAAVDGSHVRAKELLIDRHLDGSFSRGEDVFVALLDFRRELTARAAAQRRERDRLQDALAEAEAEIARSRSALCERGIPAFAWSEAPSRSDESSFAALERRLRDRALTHVLPAEEPARTLRIRAGDAWPDRAKPAYDLIVLDAALESAEDPEQALARCRAALRAGGRLVAIAATMALATGRRRGFTEASLRALLCEHFPAEEVRLRCSGNLTTSLCCVLGVPTETLRPGEIEAIDPAHATLLLGSARLPARRLRTLATGSAAASGRGDGHRGRARSSPPSRSAASPPRAGAILAYRRIAALTPDVHGLCTAPELFAAQMEMLAERCRPVTLAELVAQAQSGDVEPGTVTVTFDGGYLDNLETASPILCELGIPATFFIAGVPAERPRESWWDTVEGILLGEERVPERLQLDADGIRLDLPTRSARERRVALLALHRRLLDCEEGSIEAAVTELARWSELDLSARGSHRLMTAQELSELAGQPGHCIGAHRVHRLSPPAKGEDVNAHELGRSKAQLERLLGADVDELSYPHGDCDFAATQAAERLGFAIACTVESGAVDGDSDPLRLPRLAVKGEDAEGFGLLLQQAIGAPA